MTVVICFSVKSGVSKGKGLDSGSPSILSSASFPDKLTEEAMWSYWEEEKIMGSVTLTPSLGC